ncbi:hypothetical protein [Oceanobacillus kapialis]|uniref:Small, acid-soluble spore protein L n=1 Tax=Oceanobacillus kapialis TaxID=481353 RepID=A0ABW5PWH9_9BACI
MSKGHQEKKKGNAGEKARNKTGMQQTETTKFSSPEEASIQTQNKTSK